MCVLKSKSLEVEKKKESDYGRSYLHLTVYGSVRTPFIRQKFSPECQNLR